VYSNNTIATCILEQNITALLVFLNESYYLIVNETNSINATMITLDQLLSQLQVNMTALDATLIKSINGQLPIANQMLLSPGGSYMAVADGAPGHVVVSSKGVVTVNGVNLNRALSVVAGAGISVTQTAPNIVNVSNTVADLFANPCIMTAVTALNPLILPMVLNTPNEDGWWDFTSITKSYPACPTGFSFTAQPFPFPPFVYWTHYWTQPAGMWQLRISIQYVAAQLATCPALNGCGLTWAIGLRDTVTGASQYFDSTYFNVDLSYTTNAGTYQAQMFMNGYTLPVGRQYKFFAYYGGLFITYSIFEQVQLTAIRIG
jgi:hypothetical protein